MTSENVLPSLSGLKRAVARQFIYKSTSSMYNQQLDTRFVIKKGIRGLESIRESWKTVTEAMTKRRCFHLYEWYSAYIRCLEDCPDSVYFFVGYRADAPVAIFPMKHDSYRVCGIKLWTLSLPKHSHLPLGDCVIANVDDFSGIMQAFYQFLQCYKQLRWDVLEFPTILADSSALLCLTQGERSSLSVSSEWRHCQYLEIGSHDKRLQSFSRKFRQNMRTSRNHLKKMHGVEYTSSRELSTLFTSFSAFVDLESSGWKGSGGTSSAIKLTPTLESFYKRLLQEFSAIKACEINLLKADGEYLAGQFNLVVDGTSYVLKVAYNEKYKKVSPGHALLDWVLRKCHDEQCVSTMNFVNAVDWLRPWRPSFMFVYRAWLFNRSFRGLYGMTALKSRLMIGRFWRWVKRTRQERRDQKK